jgi:hypothetical protein
VDSRSSERDRDVGSAVDEEFRGGVAEGVQQGSCEEDEFAGGQVFFAELEAVDACRGEAGGLCQERSAAG